MKIKSGRWGRERERLFKALEATEDEPRLAGREAQLMEAYLAEERQAEALLQERCLRLVEGYARQNPEKTFGQSGRVERLRSQDGGSLAEFERYGFRGEAVRVMKEPDGVELWEVVSKRSEATYLAYVEPKFHRVLFEVEFRPRV